MDCKKGKNRSLGLASILCSFLFERIRGLIPRVDIIPHGPCDPSMSWWTNVKWQLGGGRVQTPHNYEFFFQWHRQVIDIED
jgi:hypothetical protein